MLVCDAEDYPYVIDVLFDLFRRNTELAAKIDYIDDT